MDLRADIQSVSHGPFLFLNENGWRCKTLVNGKITVLCMLEPPLVGERIAAESELQAFPFEDKTNAAINCV